MSCPACKTGDPIVQGGGNERHRKSSLWICQEPPSLRQHELDQVRWVTAPVCPATEHTLSSLSALMAGHPKVMQHSIHGRRGNVNIFRTGEGIKASGKSVKRGFLVECAHQVLEKNKKTSYQKTVDSEAVRHCEYSKVDCFACQKTDVCSRIGIIRIIVELQPCWRRYSLE